MAEHHPAACRRRAVEHARALVRAGRRDRGRRDAVHPLDPRARLAPAARPAAQRARVGRARARRRQQPPASVFASGRPARRHHHELNDAVSTQQARRFLDVDRARPV